MIIKLNNQPDKLCKVTTITVKLQHRFLGPTK